MRNPRVLRMSGFIAIVADRPERAVPEGELARFVDAYVAVRGDGSANGRVNGGHRVRACVFSRPDEGAKCLERQGKSWALTAGVPYHSRPLVETRLDELDGHFALLRYDAETKTAALASDPLGMFGLFVAERDGLTFVSTSALALARHLGAPPCRLGLNTYLMLGFQCGTRTSWEGVERLEGGVAMHFGPRGRSRSTYWRPRVDASVRRLGLAASLDSCIESGLEAVRMAGAGRDLLWCDLTGGYDTRMLALLARAAGLRFIATTNGSGSEADARLARRIAEVGGWDWKLLSLPNTWHGTFAERLPEAVGWGDAALEASQLAGVLWRHELKSQRARAVLNGGGGEHFWSCAWQHEYGRSHRTGRADLETWVRLRMLRRPEPSTVFAHNPRAEVIADLRARMERVIEPYLDEPHTVQTDVLYKYKLTGHFGAYATAAAAHVDLMMPFYSRASYNTVISINPRHRFGKQFYRRMIERLDPRVAAIPTSQGGPARPRRLTNIHEFLPYYAGVSERALNKGAQLALRRSFRRPPAAGDELAAAVRGTTVNFVGTDVDSWHSRALYNHDALVGLLARASRTDFTDSVLLGKILTAELGLRHAGAAVN